MFIAGNRVNKGEKNKLQKIQLKEIVLSSKWRGAGIVGVLMMILGISLYLPGHMEDFISVSNSVDGRELPIYCVQTEKPEIALTFDAAWGDCNLRNRAIENQCKKCNYSTIISWRYIDISLHSA